MELMQFPNLLFDETIQSTPRTINFTESQLNIMNLLEISKKTSDIVQAFIQETDCNQAIDVNAPIQKYNHSEDYYQLFFRTYTKNEMFLAQMSYLAEEVFKLKHSVEEADKIHKDYLEYVKLRNKKKNRRMAVDIKKQFQCPYDNCYKIYGSDVSLNLHIKIKHDGGNKSDRDKLAHQICMAELNGYPLPMIDVNLPPGYLEEYKNKLVGIKKEK